jgi:trehalose 6-phosphate synthase/phosphatase
MPPRGKWIIVSNRLPFKPEEDGTLSRSSGGLVTAISGIRFDSQAVWLGSFPQRLDRDAWRQAVAPFEPPGSSMRYVPVYIEPDLYETYYNGLGNDALWPLLHYETGHVRFQPAAWEAYRTVNRAFADAILEVAEDDDLVWVHDYHLFLLPKMLREANPRLRIGFFLHVPFPSSEIFRQLPVRAELLESVLGADLIGFHDYDYLRHFAASLRSILGIETNMLTVRQAGFEGHTTHLGVFPVAIDTQHFARTAGSSDVRKLTKQFRKRQNYEKLVLGVDRLDYTKGIDLKLEAFGTFLERYPEMRDKVRLLHIAVPSRTGVPEYIRLREDIERRVGELNGRFGRPNVVPIQYMFTSVPFDELLALYRVADVLFVTSKRDGMNLVALEHVACQDPGNPGVVLLSEFAGSVSFLTHALPINPWDFADTASRLHGALEMPRKERIERHQAMLTRLSKYTSTRWATSFMTSLERTAHPMPVRSVPAPTVERIVELVGSRDLRILLDYDGTIVPIRQTPAEAIMPETTRAAIERVIASPRIRMVVVSGRDAKFLQQQFEGLDVSLAAEHGARFLERGTRRWQTRVHSDPKAWFDAAERIMEDFAARTPGSILERKRFSLSWHYRRAPREFAELQARRLVLELEATLANMPANVLSGDKVIEARALEANKGGFYRWLTEHSRLMRDDPAVLVLGDDETDEDLFAAAPPAITVKVGTGPTKATYRIPRQADVLPLLEALSLALSQQRSEAHALH